MSILMKISDLYVTKADVGKVKINNEAIDFLRSDGTVSGYLKPQNEGMTLGENRGGNITELIIGPDAVTFNAKRGLIPPKLTTTERDAIASPTTGETIFNTTTTFLEVYNGTVWKACYA